MEMTEKTHEEEWPGVFSAFEFVLPSYNWGIQRADAADVRIQAMLTFAGAATVLTSTLAKTALPLIEFASVWFILGGVAFSLVVIMGVIGRFTGGLTIVNPADLYDRWLHLSEWEFKRHSVYWAGKHFESNRNLISRKDWYFNAVSALFLLEVAFLVVWIATTAS